ncbi:hypothetical protein PPTG_22521 [Phytophthora nicotianae INRA-310]|uniref:Uncharacterized protein n=1 Tax=Phytophthora nicotianae (strain INRA-310) TaxID=761204 RepID=W2QGP6_PHYN3|nr:hypothetical protein PPTG_22521 [Phytophthora nicotianae INRA-310]ETN11694.1 hypothetical protein PPTG_22521 [Phytophthora nicotianae INRA-310]
MPVVVLPTIPGHANPEPGLGSNASGQQSAAASETVYHIVIYFPPHDPLTLNGVWRVNCTKILSSSSRKVFRGIGAITLI